jgi:hypothetical protein
MAIKELFQDSRPIALLDPRASNRLDPRFTFTRNSTGTYVDASGILRTAGANQPRIDHNFATGEGLGLLVEEARTNLALHSEDFSNAYWLKTASGTGVAPVVTSNNATAPDGTSTADRIVFSRGTATGSDFSGIQSGNLAPTAIQYAGSLWIKAATSGDVGKEIQFRHVSSSVTPLVHTLTLGWRRIERIETGVVGTRRLEFGLINAGTSETSVSVHAWGAQVEAGSSLGSYVPTATGTATRAADLLSVDSLSIPSTGSIYIDAQAVGADANDTLLSLKNASNQKIDLAFLSNAATYNSTALIASYSGTSKSSLPLPVPTTDRERNIITWGSQNYQYGRDTSRFVPSFSSSVPANLASLSIGHDSVDPTKAFNGYINNVYMWSGEITPTVAEALVRGEIDAINADTYAPVGPAGSLALVVNTQGATASGNRVFTLPAESVLNDNDLVIIWGDGTESGLDGAAAELGAPGLAHTYPAAGIYPVWVEGKMQNLQFNNSADAKDLLEIATWGTGQMFTAPSTMNAAFYGCSQLQSIPSSGLPNTSAVTNWFRAFRDCSSLTGTFRSFNYSAATTFQEAFMNCSGITSFTAAGDQTQNVTNFASAWSGCSSLTSFPLINTAAGTNFGNAWQNCSSLTSFPLINTAAGTNFGAAWINCSSLTSFPLINTAAGTNFSLAWFGCSSLTSFPLINTAAGTNFGNAWQNCSSLTSFPLINTAAGTSFFQAWRSCTSLTSFPLINTAAGTSFNAAWANCSSLTSFPLINTAAGTNFGNAWAFCSSLTSFPLINTAAGTNFNRAWAVCSSLTSFPLIDTSSGTNFSVAWSACTSLTAFPALDFDAAVGLASDASNTETGLRATWQNCTSLADFPANLFDNTTCTRYLDAFNNCALTAQSIENILVSINTANTSNGNLTLSGGTNANSSTWSTAANNAYIALVGRGWTITQNGTAPS